LSANHSVIAQPPRDFAEPEIQDFIALVRAGGEVGDAALEENVRNAECLVFVRQTSCLVAVAALKNPKASYRKNIHTKAGVAVNSDSFPFELGYIFVLPSARNQGIGAMLCESALSPAGERGVFATARTNNDGMNVILPKFNFSKAGEPYTSGRGDHQLQLYLRPATKKPVTADVSHAAKR
jgi:GNAT superfamily N-acetyltransferase